MILKFTGLSNEQVRDLFIFLEGVNNLLLPEVFVDQVRVKAKVEFSIAPDDRGIQVFSLQSISGGENDLVVELDAFEAVELLWYKMFGDVRASLTFYPSRDAIEKSCVREKYGCLVPEKYFLRVREICANPRKIDA